MTYLQALILSVVEGITEFLPISSTGHLILAAYLLGITQTEFVKSFEVIIQLGAILAVVVLYFKRFFKNFRVWKVVIAGFIPTAMIGFILYKFIKEFLIGNSLITVIALLVGGIVLIAFELFYKSKQVVIEDIEKISLKQAVLIGIGQSLSVIPGVSRAAASVLSGLFVGLSREVAVEFSFLLAVPTMLAATTLDLIETDFSFSFYEYQLLAIGFIGSFIVALFVVRWLLGFVRTHSFIPFGIYRIIVALAFLTLVH